MTSVTRLDTGTGLTVRPVRPDEMAELGRITAAAYLGEALTTEAYVPQLTDVSGRAQSATVLVAMAPDGRLLGGVTLAAPGTPLAELARDDEHEVRMLAVRSDARGTGAGSALMQACRERAAADGAAALVLCSQPVMTAAHRIYGRMGFVRDPARDWTPAPGIDLWCFRLELAAPTWCSVCGKPAADDVHARCRAMADLEPPRYCPACRRRMVVQVVPSGWSARCVEHGTTTG